MAGVSPRLPFNRVYRDYLEQIARASSGALANALAYEQERKRAHVKTDSETVLRESEEKYRALFNSIDEGFCIVELVLDDRQQVADVYFREANQAFERHTGWHNVLGKTVRELLPNAESYWMETYTRVWETGQPVRLENFVQDLDRWFSAYFSRVGGKDSRLVAVVFADITKRKRAEKKLRESEERQTFLLKLSDALRALADPLQIQGAAARILGEHFNVSRAFYFRAEREGNSYVHVVDRDFFSMPDMASMAGRYPQAAFGESVSAGLSRGQTLVVRNVSALSSLTREERQAYIRLGVHSLVAVPQIKDGEYIGGFVAFHASPRNWTEIEIGLIEETAERTWAAVRRVEAESALHKSLAEQKALMKEVHHRVKNNLQVIVSLLNMQARQIGKSAALANFEEARNRVFSIAAIHESLYRSESLSAVNLADYASRLVPDLIHFYGAQGRIRTEISGDSVAIELERAVPYGLLLNELVSNACKHAFPPERPGTILVNFRQENGNIELTVADDGQGLPEGFDYGRAPSLGLQLVRSLARQLRGSVEAQSGPGTVIRVLFPEMKEAGHV